MTIIEALNMADALKPNTYDQMTKIQWLSQLDLMVKHDVYDTHDVVSPIFSGYNQDTPLDTVLLIPSPYDRVYQRWLDAQIDLANGEIDRFNASILLFNKDYTEFINDFSRKYRHKNKSQRFLF